VLSLLCCLDPESGRPDLGPAGLWRFYHALHLCCTRWHLVRDWQSQASVPCRIARHLRCHYPGQRQSRIDNPLTGRSTLLASCDSKSDILIPESGRPDKRMIPPVRSAYGGSTMFEYCYVCCCLRCHCQNCQVCLHCYPTLDDCSCHESFKEEFCDMVASKWYKRLPHTLQQSTVIAYLNTGCRM